MMSVKEQVCVMCCNKYKATSVNKTKSSCKYLKRPIQCRIPLHILNRIGTS